MSSDSFFGYEFDIFVFDQIELDEENWRLPMKFDPIFRDFFHQIKSGFEFGFCGANLNLVDALWIVRILSNKDFPAIATPVRYRDPISTEEALNLLCDSVGANLNGDLTFDCETPFWFRFVSEGDTETRFFVVDKLDGTQWSECERFAYERLQFLNQQMGSTVSFPT